MKPLTGIGIKLYLNDEGGLVISSKDRPGLQYLGNSKDFRVNAPLDDIVTAEVEIHLSEIEAEIPPDQVKFIDVKAREKIKELTDKYTDAVEKRCDLSNEYARLSDENIQLRAELAKLKARYPDKFTEADAAAENRDLAAEHTALGKFFDENIPAKKPTKNHTELLRDILGMMGRALKAPHDCPWCGQPTYLSDYPHTDNCSWSAIQNRIYKALFGHDSAPSASSAVTTDDDEFPKVPGPEAA